MLEVLFLLAGILMGFGITSLVRRIYFVGTLRIDRSEPNEPPYMFLELDKGVGDISKKKHVLLRVRNENYIPHE